MPFSTYDTWYNRGRDLYRRLLFPSPAIRPLQPPQDLPEVELRSPVFIVGSARSGTTVLSHLLQMHPAIIRTRGIPDGEDTAMWVKYAGAEIAGIGSGRAKQAIGSSVCKSMDENDVEEERRKWLRYHLWQKYQRNYPEKHILNKNSHLSNKLPFVQKIFPKAKIIHLIRNPAATIASLRKTLLDHRKIVFELANDKYPCWNIHPVTNGRYKGNLKSNRLFRENRVDLLAEYWCKLNQGILDIKQRYPGMKILTVRYEDLVNNPRVELEKIESFIGLEFYDRSINTLNTNRIDQWKKLLTGMEINQIRNILSEGNINFKYNLS